MTDVVPGIIMGVALDLVNKLFDLIEVGVIELIIGALAKNINT